MSDRVGEGAPDSGVLADDVRAVMDAAGVDKAALLAHGSPGPELAAFFAATHPERTLCLAHFGCLHYRREPDYPWGDSEEESEAYLADLDEWGSEDDAREFISGSYLGGAEPSSPPFDEPEFVAWNAKLARFAATPASVAAFVRMWLATDVRPLLGSISVPTDSRSRGPPRLVRSLAQAGPVEDMRGLR